MALFRFKAIDAKGKTVSGESGAENVDELTRILEKQGLFLMEGNPVLRDAAGAAPASGAGPAGARSSSAALPIPKRGDKVSLKAVTLFTGQLAIMVRAALPLMEGLELLAAQEADPRFKAIIRDVSRSVRAGLAMSASMSAYPFVFDEVYISLLSAGEASGKMPEMLDRIAAHLQFRMNLTEKVRSALLYPSIVIATSIAVVAFLVLFILPTFMEVFAQFDMVLPLSTRILIALSDFARRWWIIHITVIVAIYSYMRSWLSDPLHTKVVHSFQLGIPYLGPLVRNIVMTRILRTLGALVEAGVPIIRSLHLAGDSAGNLVFRDKLSQVKSSVAQGKGLAVSLGGDVFVPPTVIGMIATGEKTGTIPEVLKKVADFYEAETDSAIRNLFSVIEPVFVVVLGALVGGIAVSILLPIFKLSQGFE